MPSRGEKSYIGFNELPLPNRVTKVIEVVTPSSGYKIGEISWYSRWRQYAFFPEEYTVFSKTCLKEIEQKLTSLMDERKAERKRKEYELAGYGINSNDMESGKHE